KQSVSCPHVTFHSYFLLSILNNLFSNAIESIEEKGIIELNIEQRESDNFIIFHVRDDGPGIVEQDMSVIFSPGFTTKFNEQGVSSYGICLAYIKQTIKEHKVKIDLVTSKPNKNRKFKSELPVTLDMKNYSTKA